MAAFVRPGARRHGPRPRGRRDEPAPASEADRGRQLFTAQFTPEQGLGPLFNKRSCAGCHLEPTLGGTGRDGLATALRVGRLTAAGFDAMAERGGRFAHEHAISELGAACGRRPGIPAGVNVTSVRNAPPLFGAALIDAIPDAVIRAGAVAKGDGVRGRPNLVRGPDGRERVGRFGWKADTATLEQFVAEAFRNELGLTSPLAPAVAPSSAGGAACAEKSRAAEVERADLSAVAAFLAELPAPAPRDSAPDGARVFREAGCAACHVPALRAGRATSRSTPTCSCTTWAAPWTTASSSTPPPARIGARPRSGGLADRTRFLHDGRARTLEAAILAHGGEARRARRALPLRSRSSSAAGCWRSCGRSDRQPGRAEGRDLDDRSRQLGMLGARPAQRQPDPAAVGGDGDAVELPGADDAAPGERDPGEGHDPAVLAHAHDRAGAAVGDVQVRAAGGRRVARERGIGDLGHRGREIDRRREVRALQAARLDDLEDLEVVVEVELQHRVVAGVGHVQEPVGHPVEDHADAARLRPVLRRGPGQWRERAGQGRGRRRRPRRGPGPARRPAWRRRTPRGVDASGDAPEQRVADGSRRQASAPALRIAVGERAGEHAAGAVARVIRERAARPGRGPSRRRCPRRRSSASWRPTGVRTRC